MVHVGKTHNHRSCGAGALVGWDGLGSCVLALRGVRLCDPPLSPCVP